MNLTNYNFKKNKYRFTFFGFVFLLLVMFPFLIYGLRFSYDLRNQASSRNINDYTIEQMMSNWPITNVDTHEIYFDEKTNTFFQVITKDNIFWSRTSPLAKTWHSGKLFESEINSTTNQFPKKIDSLAFFNNGKTIGQIVTYENKWWLRNDINNKTWSGSGDLFQNEQNTSNSPFPYKLDTNTIFPFNNNQGQTITFEDRYWFRKSLSGVWDVSRTYSQDFSYSISPSTHTAFVFKNQLAEVFTKDGSYWYRYSVLIPSLNKGSITTSVIAVNEIATKKISSSVLGFNLVWPFPIANKSGQLQDSNFLSTVQEFQNDLFVRYPGGHWSEWYNWYEGIGERNKRPFLAIVPAKQPLPNYFGIGDLLKTIENDNGKIMYIVNYQTSSPKEIRALAEYTVGELPQQIPSTWKSNLWRTEYRSRIQSALRANETIVKVNENLIKTIDPTNVYEESINALYENFLFADSVDGFGGRNDGELNDINKVEYLKKKILIGSEWMIIDKIDKKNNDLYLRRSDPSINHPVGTVAQFFVYNFDQQPGYFAWLRSLPQYENRKEPFKIDYWEIGNEPFYLKYRENCNPWHSCNHSQDTKEAYLRRYREFFSAIRSVDSLAKVGFSVESSMEFTGESTQETWSQYLLNSLNPGELSFVSPHFYLGFGMDDSDESAVKMSTQASQRVSSVLNRINSQWNVNKNFNVEVIPSEYGVIFHKDGAFEWWKNVISNSNSLAKWRESLILSNYLTSFIKSPNVTGAHYWHLHWPGMLGNYGDSQKIYPFAGLSDSSYSRKGEMNYELFKKFKAFTNGDLMQTQEYPIQIKTSINNSDFNPLQSVVIKDRNGKIKIVLINYYYGHLDILLNLPGSSGGIRSILQSASDSIYLGTQMSETTETINSFSKPLTLPPGSINFIEVN